MPHPTEIVLPVLAKLTPIGDGRFVLKPLVMDHDWINIKQARSVLGPSMSSTSIYRMIREEFLVYRRPLPCRMEVTLGSVLAFRRAVNDPEFWDTPRLQEAVKRSVRESMSKLAEQSLQRV
jgi:hypothetical protein